MKKIVGGGIAAIAAAIDIAAFPTGSAHAENFVGCPSTFYAPDFPQSGIATGVTSCPFAESVRLDYVLQPTRGVPVTISAYSPVTNESYVDVSAKHRVAHRRLDAPRCRVPGWQQRSSRAALSWCRPDGFRARPRRLLSGLARRLRPGPRRRRRCARQRQGTRQRAMTFRMLPSQPFSWAYER